MAKGSIPRGLSFAGARQTISVNWELLTLVPQAVALLAPVELRAIASLEVADRPNRVEPRAIKRRPKPHRLLKKPRAEARAELLRARRRCA